MKIKQWYKRESRWEYTIEAVLQICPIGYLEIQDGVHTSRRPPKRARKYRLLPIKPIVLFRFWSNLLTNFFVWLCRRLYLLSIHSHQETWSLAEGQLLEPSQLMPDALHAWHAFQGLLVLMELTRMPSAHVQIYQVSPN